jgi:cell division protein FtsA
MARKQPIRVALDIGTHQVSVLVASVEEAAPRIIGVGTAPSRGLRRGVVVDIEATVQAIQRALREAEMMADCAIHSVAVSLSGSHVEGVSSHGMVPMKSHEVSAEDVALVKEAAQTIKLPADREVLHVLDQGYSVDEQDGIRDPKGMAGVRLESRVYLLTASTPILQNIQKCCNRAGITATVVVLSPLASAAAVLGEEERELGVGVIDFGGGTTDFLVYHGGVVQHASVLGLGGSHLTNDIAAGLRTPASEAERLKQHFGCALANQVAANDHIEVPAVGGRQSRQVSRQVLAEIIEPRTEEILSLVAQDAHQARVMGLLNSGIVLVGGTAELPGIVELAERVLGVPVRRGVPREVTGFGEMVGDASWATGVGLLLLADSEELWSLPEEEVPAGVLMRFRSRMGDWLRDFF